MQWLLYPRCTKRFVVGRLNSRLAIFFTVGSSCSILDYFLTANRGLRNDLFFSVILFSYSFGSFSIWTFFYFYLLFPLSVCTFISPLFLDFLFQFFFPIFVRFNYFLFPFLFDSIFICFNFCLFHFSLFVCFNSFSHQICSFRHHLSISILFMDSQLPIGFLPTFFQHYLPSFMLHRLFFWA